VRYYLEQCLLSVEKALCGVCGEVFVVDNNSTDDSMPYLKSKFPWVRYIENDENVGFSRANNQAIREARGEYVLLLNPDTFIGERSLRECIEFMDKTPQAGMCGVGMLRIDGSFAPESRRGIPTPFVAFCKMSGLGALFPKSRLFGRYYMQYLNKYSINPIEIVSGAFMFIRKAALDKVGLLDETFFMYGEDIDLSYRVLQAGYKNYYLPTQILHYKGESTKHGDIKYVKAFYGAMLIFYRKYYPQSSWLMSLLIQFAVLLKASLSAIGGWLGLKRKPHVKHSRLLILCKKEAFEEVKVACLKKMPGLEYVNLWDLNEERVMDVICRKNQMKEFTDIAFCYPDMRFEQMLLLMDKMVNKKITYHIYNKDSKVLV
jgi:GT2 family glycosyltransferase